MQNTLIDAGPIIALFNKRDSYHTRIIKFLENKNFRLCTTWPVVTEVCHILSFSVPAQINFLEWIRRGGLTVTEIKIEDLPSLIDFTKKHQDVPMDLADASLMIVAESLSINKIISIDTDFYIYRDIRKNYLKNIFLQDHD
jgi:predicted nucleic acid-binding protein